MNKVAQILKAKGDSVQTISKDASVAEAIRILAEKRIGSVIVMDGEKVVGIFTERDFVRKIGQPGKDSQAVKIAEVMTADLITVNLIQSVNECMALMTENCIRHLPVMDGEKLVGIVSIGDVLKDLIEELQFMVKQMEYYIQGLR